MKSNVTFLEANWPDLYQVAAKVENHVLSAPRYAALGCRIAFENAVRWLFDNDSSLRVPHQDNLAALLHEPMLKQRLPYQPITKDESAELERLVFDGLERGTKADLLHELENAKEEPKPLGAFIRRILGFDKSAAKEAFSDFLSGRNLSPDQIKFINRIISYLISNGIIDNGKLFDSPFTEINANGVDGVFRGETQVVKLLWNY